MLGVGFFAMAVASIGLSRLGTDIAGLWFANAFAFAVMLRTPAATTGLSWIAVAVASTAANLAGGSSLAVALLFSLSNLVGIAASLMLVRRRLGTLMCPPQVGEFVSILALVSGLAMPAAAILFAGLAAPLFGWPALETAWTWWLANVLGLALILPVALSATWPALVKLRDGRMVRVCLIGVLCAAIACVALSQGPFPFAVAMLPLLVVAAHVAAFELAAICTATGLALLVTAFLGGVPGLDGGVAAFRDGFQIAVAITVLMPFLAGMLIQQLNADRRRIAESEQHFRRAMHDSAIGVCIVALDGRIVEANAAFATMLGYRRDEVERLTFFDITHPEDRGAGDETMRKVRAGEADSYRFEKRYLRKDGTAVWTLLSGSVIRDPETGAPLHLVSQIEDIDARKKSEAAIAEAETRWNFALASAGQGVWELDMRRGGVTYSATWKEMLGYGPDDLDGDPDRWLTMVHPDDLDRVVVADTAHMKGLTPYFEAEFRMRHKDGHWIWILDRGKAVERDAKGRLVRAIGSLTDITRRKEAEARLIESAALLADEKERLRVTLQSIGDAVICTDADNRITFMNTVAEKLTGIAAEQGIGKPLGRVYRAVDEETGETLRPRRKRTAKAPAATEQNSRAVLVRRNGARVSIRQVVSPIAGERGDRVGSVIVFQDFTDARSLQRELAYAAAHDGLTGLANRASFIRTMEGLVAEAPDGAAHQFLFIDLDNFKAVNDNGGHAAGDALLKAVGAAIRGAVRAGDTVARLGGDEFAVVLKSCSAETGRTVAEGLVAGISRLTFSDNGRTWTIGASIGMSAFGAGGAAVDEIIARADQACYRAKAAGRGCVVVADEQDEAITPKTAKAARLRAAS